MNRLKMAREIAERVPILAVHDKDEWQKAERLRTKFVEDYPINKIKHLNLDEYIIGKGAENRSFCYRIERTMDVLGRIQGATAFKFGVYFGKTKSDPALQYRFSPKWGDSTDKALKSVKEAIVSLHSAVAGEDSQAIADNPLSPMFKGKILFLYYPNRFAPVYSGEHLKHFISKLDLSGSFKCEAEMQQALMDYRATWPDLMAQPTPLYMRFLYDLFGYPKSKNAATVALAKVPLLDEAVEGAEFIYQMPTASGQTNNNQDSKGKLDFEAKQKQQRRVGDRGEAIVLAMEKRRLILAGKQELAARIKHISQEDDSAGYDILSFDDDGVERPIEVKATTGRNLDRGFYISINELEKAKQLTNYYLYLVFAALEVNPRVLPLKNPRYNSGDFLLRPLVYQAILPS